MRTGPRQDQIALAPGTRRWRIVATPVPSLRSSTMAHIVRNHRVRTFSIITLLALVSLLGSLGSRALAQPTVNTGGSGGSATVADAETNLPPSSRADYHGDSHASYAAALQDMEHAGGTMPVAGVVASPDEALAPVPDDIAHGNHTSSPVADAGINLPSSSRDDYHGEVSSIASLPPEIVSGRPS